MTTSSSFEQWHAIITIQMRNVGLLPKINTESKSFQDQIKEEKNGICAGLVQVWGDAELGGNEAQFDDILKLICTTPDLADRIKLAEEKKEDSKYLEAAIFLRNVKLYFKPEDHHELFEKAATQTSVEKISRVIKPLDSSHLIKIYSHPEIVGSQTELHKSFEKLTATMRAAESKESKSNPIKERMFFSISSENHRIGLRYNPKDNVWILLDPNKLPRRERISPDKIADAVMKAFPDKPCFNVTAYTSSNNPLPLKQKFAQLKNEKLHSIDAKIATQLTHNNIGIAYIAAKNGDMQTLKKLADIYRTREEAKRFLELERKDNGWTPAHTAAKNGHTEVISFMAQYNVNFYHHSNAANINPISLALQNKQWDAALIMLLSMKNLDGLDFFNKKMISDRIKDLENAFINLLNKSSGKYSAELLENINNKKSALSLFFHMPYPTASRSIFRPTESKGDKPIVKINAEFAGEKAPKIDERQHIVRLHKNI